MCGIAGLLDLDFQNSLNTELLSRMTNLVRHRGPDDEGYLIMGRTGTPCPYHGSESMPSIKAMMPALPPTGHFSIGFGFRRLAIHDISDKGHQPMHDALSGLSIVFNGEIYNYIELRNELRSLGYEFCSDTDTEVILKAYQAWGDACLHRFNGIWAIAIWDESQHHLFCSRDRFGVKPFYYTQSGMILAFGSEIKQLLSLSNANDVNLSALRRGMQINAMGVYADETYWTHIHALEPGHTLSVQKGIVSVMPWYQLDKSMLGCSSLSFADAVKSYRELFSDAVRLQIRSDVEVGSCLSGGLDSSAIVCTAAPLYPKSLQVFSSYYESFPDLDERKWIEIVRDHAGCSGHLVSPTARDAWQVLQEGTWFNEMPLGAGCASQYAVMRLARGAGVSVLLDGQGSDELTGGYKHAQYRFFADLLRNGNLGAFTRDMLAFIRIKGMKQSINAFSKSILCALLPESRLYQLEFNHYRSEPFSKELISQQALKNEYSLLARIENLEQGRLTSFLFNMIYSTSLQTLLHYEDRMSMAHAVESRVPFLDHRLVELAMSLPSAHKIKPPAGKVVHREAIKGIVPESIANRRDKAIFGAPFHCVWMRQELRRDVEHMLYSNAARKRGLWNMPIVHNIWQSYLGGNTRAAESVFNIIATETWLQTFVPDFRL